MDTAGTNFLWSNTRGHTSEDYLTVAVDAKPICAWSEIQKNFKTVSPDSIVFLYLRRQDIGLQVSFWVGPLKLQRTQFLQQFKSNASKIIPAHWTTATTELLQLIQPSLGSQKPTDIFSIRD